MRIENDILDVACRTPDRPAIEEGGRTVTFGRLVALADDLAGTLRAAGVRPAEPVWLLLPNSTEFLVSLLGILRCNGVVVPVNPRLAGPELNQLAELCPPAAVIAPWEGWQRSCGALAGEHMPRVLVRVQAGLQEVQAVAGAPEKCRTIGTQQDAAGVVFFTSGSTGNPKGILLTHTNVASAARSVAQAFCLNGEDRTIVCMQMCHSFTFTKQMLCHLGRGATLVLAPDFFQPTVVLEMIDRCRCTTICAVPSMYVMLLDQIRRAKLRLPTLRILVSCSAPLPEATHLGLVDALPHAEFISYYGLSEAVPFVSCLPGKWARSKVGSVGLAAPGVEILVVDEHGQRCAANTRGEVCVRSPNVMAGYLNNPQATARLLRDGLLHTGDVGWLDEDGFLYLCGRQDDMILRGAENVYPAQIESVLYDHPGVAQAAVVGVPHAILGYDLVAFVVARPGISLAVESLRQHCRSSLASFKVPRHYHLVAALPMTPNGKILRRELRDRLLAQRSVGAPALTEEERRI